jgi:diacylglycerol kinase family enzyme
VKRVVIFANPISGRGCGERMARRIERALDAAGFNPILWLGIPSDFGTGNFSDEISAVVVIGGDGTVRAAAARLYAMARSQSRVTENTPVETPPLLIVPLGTANLLGRHLGIMWDDAHLERQVVAALRENTVVELDIATANGEMFLLMAGIGFDAAVVHELSRVRSGPISYFSYLEPAARIAGSYRFPRIRVEVDGETIFGPTPGVAFVGNVREYGTGFPMLPLARPNDGVLDICCMPCANVLDATRLFLSAAAGEHLQQEGVVYAKGRHVKIDSPAGKKIPVQIDGDAAGYLPLEIDMLPAK